MKKESELYSLEEMPYHQGVFNLTVCARGEVRTLSLGEAELVEICQGVLQEFGALPEAEDVKRSA